MRKRVIIISALLIFLIGAYFAVNKINVKKPDNTSNNTQKEEISIFKIEKDNIVSMTLSSPNNNYAFVKDGDKWIVSGMESIKLNNTKVDNLAYDFASINADVIIEETGDLSTFGFNTPLGTPSIKLSDGTEKKFIIGNKTPTGSGYYFKTNDSDTVYTVYSSKCDSFIAPLNNYRDTTLANVDASKLKELKIKRSDANIILQAKTEEEMSNKTTSMSTWKMISPYKRDCDSYYLENNLFKNMSSIEISKFVEDSPSAYSKYGLDNPKYVVGFTEAEASPINIMLGNAIDDEVYVKLDNEKSVYTVKSTAFSYKDINPMNLVDTLAYIQSIDKVNSITFTALNETYVLKIVHDGDNSTYFINDISADEDSFKKTYQEAIGLLIRGNVTGSVGSEIICKMVYNFNDGRADDIVEVVPYQDRYAAVKVNGKAQYYIMKEQAVSLIDKIKNFSQNPGKQ